MTHISQACQSFLLIFANLRLAILARLEMIGYHDGMDLPTEMGDLTSIRK